MVCARFPLARLQLLAIAAQVQLRLGRQLLPPRDLGLPSVQRPLASLDALAMLVEGPLNGFGVLDDLRLAGCESPFHGGAICGGGRTVLCRGAALSRHWAQDLLRLASCALAHLLGEALGLLAACPRSLVAAAAAFHRLEQANARPLQLGADAAQLGLLLGELGLKSV